VLITIVVAHTLLHFLLSSRTPLVENDDLLFALDGQSPRTRGPFSMFSGSSSSGSGGSGWTPQAERRSGTGGGTGPGFAKGMWGSRDVSSGVFRSR